MPPTPPPRRAMTIVEILTVIGVIVVLAGVLLAALTAVRGSGQMADSQNRLRQIGLWVQAYATDHRETILPSRFDYRGIAAASTIRAGKVRATVDMQTGTNQVNPAVGPRNAGTWADIIWTQFELGPLAMDGVPEATHDYSRDSPDTLAYKVFADLKNPLRSAGNNCCRIRPTFCRQPCWVAPSFCG